MRICNSFIILFSLFLHISISAQYDTSLVLLKSIDATIVQDIRYATNNNFTGRILYPSTKIYLRKETASKLSDAHKFLMENHNLRIKIYDGYRPLSVQKILWKVFPDERYVANPAKGSRHNRGAAVDVTLIDKYGNELDMGTSYDDFTKKAHYNFEDLPDEIKQNRKLLREVMIQFGFSPINSEWWHFDMNGWSKYSVLDIPIN